MIQILLVHATSFKSFYIKGGPPFREPIICDTVVLQMQECDIDVKLIEILQIVPFGGSRPQPTTLPTVAVACSHPLRPHWAMRSTYSYLKHLICIDKCLWVSNTKQDKNAKLP